MVNTLDEVVRRLCAIIIALCVDFIDGLAGFMSAVKACKRITMCGNFI